MEQEKRTEIITVMKNLSTALNKYHGSSQTAQYVQESLIELQKSKAVDFIGNFVYFLLKASMLRTSEGIKLNETESKLWHELAAYKDVGYKLFPSFGM